jgi:cyclopropane fatty-acyl-phospholipid synthase-like methyltransferase
MLLMATNIPTKETFREMYAHCAPWDIGRPQQPFVQAAAEIKGSVLDAGCGTGDNALFFAERGCTVTGVDFLEGPIKLAKQKATQRGIQARFWVHDALKLSALGQQFDNIIDSGLFHVFSDEDRKRYVPELAAVLKTGGKYFMMCFSDKEPGTEGPRRVLKAEIEVAFAHGWKIESLDAVHFEISANLPPHMKFSPGGPHAWFAKIRREKQ